MRSRIGRILSCAFLSLYAPLLAAKTYRVGISQIVELPSLNEIREGLIATLRQEPALGAHLVTSYLNAQGDRALAAQVANKLVGDKPDVIVGISTPSTQALVATKTAIPIVFTGINDPLGAKLVKNLEQPGGNVSGIMLVSPVREQIELILEVLPQAKRIAILYNGGETNSTSIASIFKAEMEKLKLSPLLLSISRSSEVQPATRSLVGRVDAVYLPTDNTVISAIGTILQIGVQSHLPIFAADTASVQSGALAALGIDHYALGVETGKMVARILHGEKVGQIPVVRADKNELHINRLHAKAMNVNFPPSLLQKARKVYH